MAHPTRSRRGFLLPALVALAMLIQASGATLALQPVSVASPVDAAPVAPAAVTGLSPVPDTVLEPVVDPAGTWAKGPALAAGAATAARLAAVRATPVSVATAESVAAPSAPRAASTGSTSTAKTYSGRNRVWIPSLGINRAIEWFPCTRTKPPGHQVYRWGCAGANNVYLFAHAASLFKPLHDLYAAGRLRKGLEVVYADPNGRITRYAVSYWKVVKPDGDIEWAYAAQSRPSMTLQTCVGANSEYRLVVRLIRKG